jgi:hypothetical protein
LDSIFGAGEFLHIRGLRSLEIVVSYVIGVRGLFCADNEGQLNLVLAILQLLVFHLGL